MAGCFGNHPVDRWMEGQLYRYLDRFDEEETVDFIFEMKISKGKAYVHCDVITGNYREIRPKVKFIRINDEAKEYELSDFDEKDQDDINHEMYCSYKEWLDDNKY
jgi:hypothetical protein